MLGLKLNHVSKRGPGINALDRGKCGINFKSVISKHVMRTKLIGTSGKITLSWMLWNTFVD